MDSFRKWFYRPRRDDPSLLAQFYYADEELNLVASELDTFDGRKDPERCTALVNQLRHCQDKVVSLCMGMMDAVIPGERANRDFRAKFPDDVMQENLAGQLWFGAECLAAGSSILNRESESSRMRPLAKAVTKTIETVRNLLREQCLKPLPEYSEKIRESLKIFDRLFSEFELSYVSAMVPVKSPEEHEVLQAVVVLFSETVHRALVVELISQDQVDYCDPALMFTIPRLAIVAGLLFFPDGPLNLDTYPRALSPLFRPFRTLLSKIRELLWTMSTEELAALEKSLCSLEEPLHSSLTLPVNSTYATPAHTTTATTSGVKEDAELPAYAHAAYTSNFIQSFLAKHPHCRTLTADANLLPHSEKRPSSNSSSTRSSSERKRDRDSHHHHHRSSGSGSSSHRSSSSRTRLRQERLSDRFLAKLTGVEERPRARRRSKRSSSSSSASTASSYTTEPLTPAVSCENTLPSTAAAAGHAPAGQSSDEGRGRKSPRTGDPYSARRREYLAQHEVRRLENIGQPEAIRRKQALLQQLERIQRLRQQQTTVTTTTTSDGTPCVYTSDSFRDTIEQHNQTPQQSHRTRSPVAPVTLPLPPPPPPPPSVSYTVNNDSASDQEISNSSQQRHRRRSRPSNAYVSISQFSVDSERHVLNSNPMLPRVPAQTSPVDDADVNPYSENPLEAEPQQPLRHHGSRNHNSSNMRCNCGDSQEIHQHNCAFASNTPEHSYSQDSNSFNRTNNIQTIECSCGSTIRSSKSDSNIVVKSNETELKACEGYCENRSQSQHDINGRNNYLHNFHGSEINTNVINESTERPNSIYIARESAEQLLGNDADVNYATLVSIGECVSSAVAADPTIFGAHNLYVNPDLLVPDYPLDDASPAVNETFSEGKISTILEEHEGGASNIAIDTSVETTDNNETITSTSTTCEQDRSALIEIYEVSAGTLTGECEHTNNPSNSVSSHHNNDCPCPNAFENEVAESHKNKTVNQNIVANADNNTDYKNSGLEGQNAVVDIGNIHGDQSTEVSAAGFQKVNVCSAEDDSSTHGDDTVSELTTTCNLSDSSHPVVDNDDNITASLVLGRNTNFTANSAHKTDETRNITADDLITFCNAVQETTADSGPSFATNNAGSHNITDIAATNTAITSSHIITDNSVGNHIIIDGSDSSQVFADIAANTTADNTAYTNAYTTAYIPGNTIAYTSVHTTADTTAYTDADTTEASASQRVREDVGESSSSGDSGGSDGGVMSEEDELNDEEVALALQAAEVAATWRSRTRFSDPRDLIQRLFVCISGVADQLQTNYASDLRRILKTVFLLNQTPASDDQDDEDDEVETDGDKVNNKAATPSQHDHDGHSTSNDSESLSVESAEDALAAIGSSQPSSPTRCSQRRGGDGGSGSGGDDTAAVISCPPPPSPLPTVCVPPAVFNDHALLQFSEVSQGGGGNSGAVTSNSASVPHLASPQVEALAAMPSPDQGSTAGSTTVSTAGYISGTATASSATRSTTLSASSGRLTNPGGANDAVPPVSSGGSSSAVGGGSQHEPPSWVPDQDAPRCMACGASFTVLRRRHHCRNCGKVFCGGCSQHAVPLPHYGIWKPVRVCNICFLQYVTAAASASS